MRKISIVFSAAVLSLSMAASAAETVTYSYDAKGRLVKVVRVGSGATPVNANVRIDYAHDKVDNRKTVTVTR